MSDQLQLRVVTPRRLVLDEPVTEITAPGTLGELGILPNHITFLGTLEIGSLSFRSQRKSNALAIRGGFAEVSDNVVTVLAEAAEFPEDVDVVGAEQDLRDSVERLSSLSPVAADELALAEAQRRWAEARLDVARQT